MTRKERNHRDAYEATCAQRVAELAKRIERATFSVDVHGTLFGSRDELLLLREALRIAERVDFKLTPDQVLFDAREKYREHKANLGLLAPPDCPPA